jgi:hypothetical protein
MLPAALLVLFL